MKKVIGYVMNRVEKYEVTNGDEDKILTFITLLGYEGIEELYAVGDVAEGINEQFSKGDKIECTLNVDEEIIFGKKVYGRIISV